MSNKCEACGKMVMGEKIELVYVRTTNGGLSLCQQCLEDINQKNPVFEIMRKRLWFPRFCGTEKGKQRWVAFSWQGVCNLIDTLPVYLSQFDAAIPTTILDKGKDFLVYPSPDQAIIEADKWYKEQVEKG